MALDIFADEIYDLLKSQTQRRFRLGAGVSLLLNRSDLTRLAISHKEAASDVAEAKGADRLAAKISAEGLDLKYSGENPYSSKILEFEIIWTMLQKGLAGAYNTPRIQKVSSLQTYREILVDSMNKIRKSVSSGVRMGEDELTGTILSSAEYILDRNARIAAIHKRREDRKRVLTPSSELENLIPSYQP